MNYPLDLRFKMFAINSQISVTDATGNLLLYVKQKAFRIKEDITVYRDESQREPLYYIKADRMMDFSARFHFTDADSREIGSVKREGVKSLWKAHYDVSGNDQVLFSITEAKPWLKVASAVLDEVPFVKLFSGLIFTPAYDLKRPDGTPVFLLERQRSMTERHFRIEKVGEISEKEEIRAVLGLLMTVLLERTRA